MVKRKSISDEKIQDYIDGRLNDHDHASVAAFLLANPDIASRIQRLRDHNDALKAVGTDILAEPVPERLRAVVENARNKQESTTADTDNLYKMHRRGFWEGLAFSGALAAGIVIGWIGHGELRPGFNQQELALLTARDAYLFYSQQRDYPVDITSDRKDQVYDWYKKSFGRGVELPDLDDLGYKFVGGRLVPWSQGQLGLNLYQNNKGSRASVLTWPAKTPWERTQLPAKFENVQVQYHWQDGIGYAVMCDEGNDDFASIAKAVLGFLSDIHKKASGLGDAAIEAEKQTYDTSKELGDKTIAKAAESKGSMTVEKQK